MNNKCCLIDCLIDCFIDCLIDCLIDCSINCFIDCFTDCFIYSAERHFSRSQASKNHVTRRYYRLCEYYYINPLSYTLAELELKLSISLLIFDTKGRLQYVSSRLKPIHFALMIQGEIFLAIHTKRFKRFTSTFAGASHSANTDH